MRDKKRERERQTEIQNSEMPCIPGAFRELARNIRVKLDLRVYL